MSSGVLLYNLEGKAISPYVDASTVTYYDNDTNPSVNQCIADLYRLISQNNGDEEIVSTINVRCTYLRSSSNRIEDAPNFNNDSWTSTFLMPTEDLPYCWKRTIFSYKGASDQELSVTYEIVATNTTVLTLTIYCSRDNTISPSIEYPIITDPETGEESEDLTAFDSSLPSGWQETPISISPQTPNIYMSTRKKLNGKWEKFSTPIQFGRWAFDSKLELRYFTSPTLITSDLYNLYSTNPGDNWSATTNENQTGRLYMLTATSVNGMLNGVEVLSNNEEDRGKMQYWYGPHLLGIIL